MAAATWVGSHRCCPTINKPPCACPPPHRTESLSSSPRDLASRLVGVAGVRYRSVSSPGEVIKGPSKQDVDRHRPETLRPQIRGELPGRRAGAHQDRVLRRLRQASAQRAGPPAVQQVRGGGGRAQGEAGRPGRRGARDRGARGHVHPGGGRERRRGAALLVPRGVLLHLRGQDVVRRGGPVGGLVPRRDPDGRGVRPHLHLLPQSRLRHPHPQGGGAVLSSVRSFAVAAPRSMEMVEIRERLVFVH